MDSGAGIRLFCVFIFRLFERWKYRKFGGNRLQNPNFSPQMGDFRGFPAVMKIFILGCSGAIFRCKRASVMRGCVHARRTLKGLVADLRMNKKIILSLLEKAGKNFFLFIFLSYLCTRNWFAVATCRYRMGGGLRLKGNRVRGPDSPAAVNIFFP